MVGFRPEQVYLLMMLLYGGAALSALLLRKHPHWGNLTAHGLCLAAAALGTAASLLQLTVVEAPLRVSLLQSALPLIGVDLVIDRLSAFFILTLSVLGGCVSIYSFGYLQHYFGRRDVGLFNFLYALFILSMFWVLTAGNAVFFFIAWEIMSLLSYFLVVFESEQKENQRAGTIYIIMTHLGTSFLLVGFMLMFSFTQSFDLLAGSATIPGWAKDVMFILFLIGFGTKAGVIPLHIWLPYAHPAAASNVSALMSGIMIKTAIYGLLRFVLGYLQLQHAWWGMLLLGLGLVSAVLGVAYALMEHNIKRLLAFHSIENIGIILIGLGVSFTALAQGHALVGAVALAAALFHTFNHALFKGGLFLGAGALQLATHTKDIEELGGLIKRMPRTALLMLIFSLAISAIVPFNGFVSEWLTYQALLGSIGPGQAGINIIAALAVAALAFSGALAAACFVKLFGISFLGLPRSEHALHAREAPASMQLGMGLLAGLCLAAGVYPLGFLRLIDQVGVALTGTAIAGGLQGGWGTVSYPLAAAGTSISPPAALAVMVGVGLAAGILLRVLGGSGRERRYGTWDCGFAAINSRMQYSATGFSKPLRIVLRLLYRPGRELVVEEGRSPYFPDLMKYKVSTEAIFEKYLYDPGLQLINRFSSKLEYRVQTGSIHMYLLYIFLTMLALMLYNRLV